MSEIKLDGSLSLSILATRAKYIFNLHITRIGLLLTCPAQTKLYCLSEPPILEVFSDQGGSAGQITDVMRAAMDDLVCH